MRHTQKDPFETTVTAPYYMYVHEMKHVALHSAENGTKNQSPSICAKKSMLYNLEVVKVISIL